LALDLRHLILVFILFLFTDILLVLGLSGSSQQLLHCFWDRLSLLQAFGLSYNQASDDDGFNIKMEASSILVSV
jgi:hypothetical protein